MSSRARLVASRDIVDGSIVNADVNASAAIAASKLSGVVTPTSTDTLTNKTISAANNTLTGVVVQSLVDAKGDLIVGTANDTVGRLAAGANGRVLSANSATATGLEWIVPAAGGETLLASGSFSGSAVNLTGISSAYRHLRLIVRQYRPATSNPLMMRFNNDSNAGRYVTDTTAGGQSAATFPSSSIQISGTDPGTDVTTYHFSVVDIYDYTNTTTFKLCFAQTAGMNGGNLSGYRNHFARGVWSQTSAVNEINLLPLSGNFTSGSYLLYGVN